METRRNPLARLAPSHSGPKIRIGQLFWHKSALDCATSWPFPGSLWPTFLARDSYARREILDACNIGSAAKAPSWQAGVWDAKEEQSELLAFTLDKSSGSFSPSTRYRDYAITPRLIHWESQSAVRADSNTGLRYRNHAGLGRSVLLFARLRADDRAFWFLGTGQYRGHVGERPMAITWELDHPLPGDLFAQFAAAVA